MDISKKHLWEITPIRDLLVILAIMFATFFVYALREIFTPVFIAIVLAYLFNPVITKLEIKYGWPRRLTSALAILFTALVLAGFIVWLGPTLSHQLQSLAKKAPEYLDTLAKKNEDVAHFVERFKEGLSDLQEQPTEAIGDIFANSKRFLGVLKNFFGTASMITLSIVLIPIFFFIFAWRFNSGVDKIKKYLPKSIKADVIRIAGKMDVAVGGFFRGRVMIAGIIGLVLSLGYFLTDVPYWFVIGMVTGFLNIIPYAASFCWPLVILIKYIDTLSSGGDMNFVDIAVWPSVIFLVVQFLDDWVLTPLVQSTQTDMNAASLIIIVFIGGALGGVLGLLFAIPVAACIKIILTEVVLPRARRWSQTN